MNAFMNLSRAVALPLKKKQEEEQLWPNKKMKDETRIKGDQ